MTRRIHAALLRLRLAVTRDPAARRALEIRIALLEGNL